MKKNIDQQTKVLVLIGSVFSLVILSLGGFYIYKTMSSKTDVEQTHIQQDDFYSIRNNATPLQKELYDALNASLAQDVRDDVALAGLVAQNYVADFYTWTNKFRMNDVGGIQFVHEDIRVNVYQAAQSGTYRDMYYYLNNGGLKDTLEVSEVTQISATPIDYFIFDSEGSEEIYDEVGERYRMGDYHDAFEVKLRWQYQTSDKVNPNQYEQNATFILMINAKGVPMVVEVSHEAA